MKLNPDRIPGEFTGDHRRQRRVERRSWLTMGAPKRQKKAGGWRKHLRNQKAKP